MNRPPSPVWVACWLWSISTPVVFFFCGATTTKAQTSGAPHAGSIWVIPGTAPGQQSKSSDRSALTIKAAVVEGHLSAKSSLASPTSDAQSATILFDLSGVSSSSTPMSQIVQGFGATLSSPADPGGFTLENPGGLSIGPNILADPGPSGASGIPLTITFSQPITSVTLQFATDGPGSFALAAFSGSASVGSATAAGTVPAGLFFPQGVISFSTTDADGFNSIVLTSSGTPYFAIANISVTFLCGGLLLPTGETTAFDGWDPSTVTIGKWKQTLSSTAVDFIGPVNFAGRMTQEADTGDSSDTCYFPGSAVPPSAGLTGGTWNVNADNTWGDDFVGFSSGIVTYYRLQGRVPCGATHHQQMTMSCPDGSFQAYGPINTLKFTFTGTTVSSVRAGSTATRRY